MLSSFIGAYDFAVRTLAYTKFGSILELDALSGSLADKINKGVILAPRAIAQRQIAEKRTETSVEFISVWRDSVSFAWERQRSILARRGLDVILNDGTSRNVIAVPADIKYSLCFWSRSNDKIAQCMEEYLFWWHTNPKITLTFNDLFTINPDLTFGEITDHSTISELFTKGQLFVYEMPVVVEAWLLKSPEDLIGQIHKIRLTIYDKDEVTDYESIYVEDSNQDTEMEGILHVSRIDLYELVAINLTGNSISIEDNRTSDFVVGCKVKIQGSTGNDSVYVVDSVTYNLEENLTTLVLHEGLRNEIVDGVVCKFET